MREVGAFEAKTKLSQLLIEVGKGEKIAITRHGRKIALLIPVQANTAANVNKAISGIEALHNKIAKRGTKFSMKELQEMKEAGRK